MDPILAVELVKTIVQLTVKLAEAAGLSDEELDRQFQKAREELLKRDPSNLPDV